jgi:hypothetical protein
MLVSASVAIEDACPMAACATLAPTAPHTTRARLRERSLTQMLMLIVRDHWA